MFVLLYLLSGEWCSFHVSSSFKRKPRHKLPHVCIAWAYNELQCSSSNKCALCVVDLMLACVKKAHVVRSLDGGHRYNYSRFEAIASRLKKVHVVWIYLCVWVGHFCGVLLSNWSHGGSSTKHWTRIFWSASVAPLQWKTSIAWNPPQGHDNTKQQAQCKLHPTAVLLLWTFDFWHRRSRKSWLCCAASKDWIRTRCVAIAVTMASPKACWTHCSFHLEGERTKCI